MSKNVESEAFVGEGQPSGGVIEMNELTGDDELYSYGDALYYFVTSAITGTCMISTEDTMFFKDGQGNEIPVRIQVNHFIMQGDSNYVLVNNILAASRYDKVTKECVSK
ncbi:MAG: hypothetical protein H8E20_04510 [Verrucomicrobia bacterium]|nr:hypothetical protein [Verrucomicrobiota bacterium]